MNVFAIGDLHLPGGMDKPMDVFGANWKKHDERIRDAWLKKVGADDIVLLPGDFSWAMQLAQVKEDLRYLDALPGTKVMIRGNHDYWWSSLKKVREALPRSVHVLQNDCYADRGLAVCGTRGWACPGSTGFDLEDQKIYLREAGRLKLSLEKMPKDGLRIVMLHYPPFNERFEETAFSEQIAAAKVDIVLYGHLHAHACKHAFEGVRDQVKYYLVSADHIGFSPKLIATL